jgi:hypothetical protein
MRNDENDSRDNKQYHYKQDKIVKFIYERAASWDEERRWGGWNLVMTAEENSE